MFRPSLILIATFLAGSATAETFVSDGFGLVPEAAFEGERAQWSGLRAQHAGSSVTFSTKDPEAVDSVMLFIGPKSLIAGFDRGHAVSVAVDSYGNLAADGFAGVFRLGPDVLTGAPTRYGISDLLFTPTTRAGMYPAGVDVAGVQSARGLFRVTADLGSVALEFAPPQQSEPEQVMPLATQPLRDRFGNVAEDGTALAFLLDHGPETTGQDGLHVSVLTARSVDGVGRAELLARDMPPTAQAEATMAGNRSPVSAFEIAQVTLQDAPDIRLWRREDLPELRLRLGPLQTDAGHLIYEGAEIGFHIRSPKGEELSLTGWAQDGYVWLDLPMPFAEGEYQIKVESAFGSSVTTLRPGPAPRDARAELMQ